jgi:hypothetical protein
MPEILAKLVSHRSRWEHLQLHLLQCDVSKSDGPMPLLQHLRLLVGTSDPSADSPVFSNAPQLQSVILDKYAPSNVTLPWSQLTSLALNLVHRPEYLPILQHAPSTLHDCALDILWSSSDALPHLYTKIKVPCLELLIVNDSNDNWMGSYPDVFVVPALCSLRITESFLAPNPIHALASFIALSRSTPQEVCVVGAQETSDTYHMAFPAIPNFSVIPREHAEDM